MTQSILNLFDGLHPDLCLLGGDYCSAPLGASQKALSPLKDLINRIKAPNGTFAVLGNHDSPGMVNLFKQDRVTFLMNGTRSIIKGGQCIRIAGIDDPACYGRYGFTGQGALDEINETAEFTIVVSHRPDFYKKAAKHGADFYLCGHTHAGQVQLPFIGPVFTNGKVHKKMIHGKWMYKEMQGYTSSGAGTTGIPLRYGCRGEVVLITLTLDTH
ncbi:MAG: metallophosphoesterase [Desulfobacterales bacterium]|nr:metallophosphoesterase [Desulfobacterales bacterium]